MADLKKEIQPFNVILHRSNSYLMHVGKIFLYTLQNDAAWLKCHANWIEWEISKLALSMESFSILWYFIDRLMSLYLALPGMSWKMHKIFKGGGRRYLKLKGETEPKKGMQDFQRGLTKVQDFFEVSRLVQKL